MKPDITALALHESCLVDCTATETPENRMMVTRVKSGWIYQPINFVEGSVGPGVFVPDTMTINTHVHLHKEG